MRIHRPTLLMWGLVASMLKVKSHRCRLLPLPNMFLNIQQHWSFSASKAPLVLIQCYYLVTSVLNLDKHVNQDFHVNATRLEHLTQQTTYCAISGRIDVALDGDIDRLLSNIISFPLTQTSFTPSSNLSL